MKTGNTGFKKVMASITVFVMLVGAFSGCGQKNVMKNENSVYINTKYADEGMVSINGEKFNYNRDNSIFNRSTGVGAEFKPDHMKSLLKNQTMSVILLGGEENINYGYSFVYSTKKADELSDSLKKTIDQEKIDAISKKIGEYMFSFAEVIRIPNDPKNKEGKIMKEAMEEEFKNIEKLGELNQNTYYFAYNTDCSKLILTDNEKADIKKLIDEVKLFKSGICLYPVPEENQGASEKKVKSIGTFSAKTLDGATVTEESFKDYDLTMINIWATFCGPCKEEMKDLAELHKSLPKNVNMTSICTDAADESELAQKIIDSNNGKFKVIIPDKKLTDSLLKYVTGVPTTFFVDKSGNVVGEPIVGAANKEEYMKDIKNRLELEKKSNESVEITSNKN